MGFRKFLLFAHSSSAQQDRQPQSKSPYKSREPDQLPRRLSLTALLNALQSPVARDLRLISAQPVRL